MVIKERKHWPISAIVYLALFYGIIILLIFMAFKGGLLPLMLLLIPIILLFYDYATRVDWDIRGLKKAKNVLFLDGTIGVAESTITPEYGGRATLMVAIKPDYCPENEWERMPKMRGALATLASRVHLQVTREKWKFIELVGEECGAPEGAILILSGADPDRKIRLIDERVFSQLEYNDSVLRKLNNIVETSKAQMAVDSKEAATNAVEIFQTMIPILREWSRGQQQKQQILPNVQGG